VESPLYGLADWATDLIESTGYVGVGVLVALANVLPPVPVELIVVLSGFVAGEEALWLPLVVLSATAGSIAGGLAQYALGYWLGEARLRLFVKRYGRYLFLKESDLDTADRWFERHGGKAVFFGRMTPGLRKVVPIPAGVARMPLDRFVAYTAFAGGLLNGVLAALGWALGDQWMVVRRYADLLEYGVLVAVAAALLWFLWNRWCARGG